MVGTGTENSISTHTRSRRPFFERSVLTSLTFSRTVVAAVARRRRLPSKAALGWGLLCFLILQIGLTVEMEFWQPQLRDGDYGWKHAELRELRRQAGDRPFVLMLGSSRTMFGFRDERFHSSPGSSEGSLAFNFGLPAAGPLKEWVCLQNLLDEGFRPDLLLVEVLPPLFNQAGPGRTCEENWIYAPGLSVHDLARLKPYCVRTRRMWEACLRSRIFPWYAHRQRILEQLAHDGLSWSIAPTLSPWQNPGDEFAKKWRISTLEQRRRWTDAALAQYADAFHDFHLGNGPTTALHDLLDRCQREKIPVGLVLMPEGSEFRRCYSAAMESSIQRMLGEVRRRYDAPIIDARLWVDDNGFWDSHHLLPEGAFVFTTRLAEAVRRIFPSSASQSLFPKGV